MYIISAFVRGYSRTINLSYERLWGQAMKITVKQVGRVTGFDVIKREYLPLSTMTAKGRKLVEVTATTLVTTDGLVNYYQSKY